MLSKGASRRSVHELVDDLDCLENKPNTLSWKPFAMSRKPLALNPYRTPETTTGLKRRSMSRSEILLKMLIGGVLGTELVATPALLALGVFTGFEKIQSPTFSATCLVVFAAIGAGIAVCCLPRFSRDRGRIADFLINPKDITCSPGSFEPRSQWTTVRYGRPTNH